MFRVAVLTVSDTVASGAGPDQRCGISCCFFPPNILASPAQKLSYFLDRLSTIVELALPQEMAPEATKELIEKETPGLNSLCHDHAREFEGTLSSIVFFRQLKAGNSTRDWL
ncbi:hypothetical protein POTOM_017989 [Populus tomentosa]|uniref:Uncharacterized protein n=1 Tax=Populus tomentosa TaxID=118781 RepID=A0A8X7ZY29_POPTO|nr:hypothetical protein POTOM_017989 [Populus tomentosa]